MSRRLVPIVARSPEGNIIQFSCRKEASEKTGHPAPAISSACRRLTPTEKGWNFKLARDARPFRETRFVNGHYGRKGTPIEDDKGVVYPNARTAALILGISSDAVHYRVRRGLYKKRPDIQC